MTASQTPERPNIPHFGVSAAKQQKLAHRMAKCRLSENQLQEKFTKSTGPGGRKVDTADSCVQLTHLPTGLQVKAQTHRTQALNRYDARKKLCRILEQRTLGNNAPQAQKQQKIQKQKQRRKRRSRQKYSPPPGSAE